MIDPIDEVEEPEEAPIGVEDEDARNELSDEPVEGAPEDTD